MDNVFFHVDLDAFFASVEQQDNPQFRGRPLVVGAAPGRRGVVAACSYEARRFGIRSAMPISTAYRLCPQAVFLPVRFDRYRERSATIMALLNRYSPEVIQISIDEASMNLTGTERLFGPPGEVALRLKRDVREATGLTLSVGIASNRYLAKLASEVRKPDGLFVVVTGREAEFIGTLALGDLWGIGAKTLARLTAAGITTVVEVSRATPDQLRRAVGEAGAAFLDAVVRGKDPGIYGGERKSRSASAERTFGEDTADLDRIRRVILELSHEVMARSEEELGSARTVTVKLRYADFSTLTMQTTLGHPVSSAEELDATGLSLFKGKWNGGKVRLVGVGLSTSGGRRGPDQAELFEGAFEKKRKVERAVREIEADGKRVIKASLLGLRRRANSWDQEVED